MLVTGGAGFIGSHLADLLLEEGWKVTVIDNFDPFYDPSAKSKNVQSHRGWKTHSLLEADIRDLEALTGRLDGEYDVIVHLAAKAGVRPSIQDPVGYQKTNILGTLNLLELARRWRVRQFVFASSSSVYGVNPRVPWREEDCVLLPISPYASTKVSAELMGHVYSHLYGIRFIALRLFTVYGPRQRPDLAIHKFARLMLANQPILMYGDGTSQRDYTYVRDTVRGIRAAMDHGDSPYEVINLGNNQPVSLQDVVRALEAALGLKAKLAQQAPQPGDVPQTWADITKAQRLLNYRPETSFATGITEFVRWLLDTTRS